MAPTSSAVPPEVLAARERLPPEISRFLATGSPQVVTVRGPPGAGKTTLALEILQQFEGFRGYISARVPMAALLQSHPWTRPEAGSGIHLLEILRFRGGPGGPAGFHVGRLRDALQARASDLVDLASVLSLPPELEELLARERTGPKLVVVDSWEAWVENLLGPTPLAVDVPTTRWELERSLLDQFRDAGVSTVLLVERRDPARLDYVADGALSLTDTESDGRTERWLSYQKLRGTPIESPSYPFTLDAGRFACIRPSAFHAPLGPVQDDPDPAPDAAGLWPGNAALALRFGRLPVPGATVLETDGETPTRLLGRLTLPIVAAALRSGGRVAVLPPSHLSPDELRGALGPVGDPADLAQNLCLLASDDGTGTADGVPPGLLGEGALTAPRLLERLDGRGFFRPLAGPTANSLVVLFVEEPFAPAGAAAELGSLLTFAAEVRHRLRRVATVLVARSDTPSIPTIRARSALHLMVRAVRGQCFLTGVRPWTPHFALTLPSGPSPGTPPYGLLPMV